MKHLDIHIIAILTTTLNAYIHNDILLGFVAFMLTLVTIRRYYPFNKRTGSYPTHIHILNQIRGLAYNLCTINEGTHVIVEKKLLIATCKSIDKVVKELEIKHEAESHT